MLRTTTRWIGVQGSPYYTTLHFGGNTSGEAQAAANAVRALLFELQNRLWGAMEGTVLPDVPSIDPATGQIIENFVTTTTPVNFAGAGEVLPFASQALVRLRTGDFIAGKELRGRVFIPGIQEADCVAGELNPTAVTALQTAFNNLLTAGGPAGSLVVWSPTHGQASVVSVAQPWNQFATLRSRRD